MDIAQEIENSVIARQQVLRKTTAFGDSNIQKFYEGSSIFVTGGSGFIGKLVIEKLLRACSPKNIYILIRAKKNKNVQQRIQEVFEDPVFELLHQEKPNFITKIVAIEGDINKERLGISDNDWNIIANEVDILFHIAANIRFDTSLKDALISNVRGTRETLNLGRACKNLRAFVYVSTAYSHATNDRIGGIVPEQFQKSPLCPEIMIKLAETLSNEQLEGMTSFFTDGWPNTYTYTKAIAEETVRTTKSDMPVCIVRPAIVIAPITEPAPGWIDMSSVYGPSGLVLGLGMGLLNVLFANLENGMSLVPAHLVTNAIIAAGWETGRNIDVHRNSKIYTISNIRNPITWGELGDIMRRNRQELATPRALWYAGVLETNSPFLFWILSWLFHFIPAYIVDGVCFLIGKERRFVKLYSKMYKLQHVLSYFTRHDWLFDDTNLKKLFESMSTTDQLIFNFDVTTINWTETVIIWWIGIRKYIIKDGLKGTKKGSLKQNVFLVLNYLLVLLYAYVILNVLWYCILAIGYVIGPIIKSILL